MEINNPDQKILVELEVFDSNGNHLGTADLEGNLDHTLSDLEIRK